MTPTPEEKLAEGGRGFVASVVASFGVLATQAAITTEDAAWLRAIHTHDVAEEYQKQHAFLLLARYDTAKADR